MPIEYVRQEIHDQVLVGTVNTKESALDVSLSAAAKKICSAAVNSREWTKDGEYFLGLCLSLLTCQLHHMTGAVADNASIIIIEVTFQ